MRVTGEKLGITLDISSNNRIVTPSPDEETDLHSSEPAEGRFTVDPFERRSVKPLPEDAPGGHGEGSGSSGHFSSRGTPENVGRLPEDPLQSAVLFLGRHAFTNGDEPFELRREAALLQRGALIRWASELGMLVDPTLWKGRTFIGGSEHDIWEEAGEYWKVIRPDRFGWTVLPGEHGAPEVAEATPLEYLQRWMDANRILGDSVRLRGVSVSDEGVQAVISHPFICGPYPDKLQILHELQSHGFALVNGFSIGSETDSSFYNDEQRIGLFDAACDNFILSQGSAIPVDLVIVSVADKLREQLLRLMHD